MTIATVSQEATRGLPQALRTAQEAIQLPEVQAMLRRLSEYNLGICMPGGSTASAVCEMVRAEGPGGRQRSDKHKM
jgi:hypothetical protein